MFLTPLANELGKRLRHSLQQASSSPSLNPVNLPSRHHVLIAGCGRVGQLVADILTQHEQSWLAIEKSPQLIDSLRHKDFPVIYGDITNISLMKKLHADTARAVVITVDEALASEALVRNLRQHFPHTPVFARARDTTHARKLQALGATQVIPEAFEAGLQLAGCTLHSMGIPEESTRHILQQYREKHAEQFLQTKA
jgi:CPA2 family monovalent cation:H+ antiporter-2